MLCGWSLRGKVVAEAAKLCIRALGKSKSNLWQQRDLIFESARGDLYVNEMRIQVVYGISWYYCIVATVKISQKKNLGAFFK